MLFLYSVWGVQENRSLREKVPTVSWSVSQPHLLTSFNYFSTKLLLIRLTPDSLTSQMAAVLEPNLLMFGSAHRENKNKVKAMWVIFWYN